VKGDDRDHRVLLVPLDPVHDVGLKIIRRALEEAGYWTLLLPPDTPPEEAVQKAIEHDVTDVLVGRTVSYETVGLLGKFVDLVEASGVRDRVRMAVGGMAVRPELAAELGFDAGFGPGTTGEEAVAFVEDRPYEPEHAATDKKRRDITEGFSYRFRDPTVERLAAALADDCRRWADKRTSPAVRRARCRERMLEARKEAGGRRSDGALEDLYDEYLSLCDEAVVQAYRRDVLPRVARRLSPREVEGLRRYVEDSEREIVARDIHHGRDGPTVFIQYGTGCPFMDVAHIKISEAWGADGVVHFDPSWGARTEGLFEGYLAHQGDGSIITPENLRIVSSSLHPSTLWQVRAHRGLNTPETALLGAEAGAHLTKINMAYGCLGGGTDPERMVVDGVETIKVAARYGLPFDVVTNEELCGVPAHKAFASMLVVACMALRLGGRPVLQPLFCKSPDVMIRGYMDDNYVDYNVAKLEVLERIIDAPIWPGAPVGFLTQTEDRVQSSVSTALHAALAGRAGVAAVTIASSDEAYSGGPISVASRVDTLKATAEALRFYGSSTLDASDRAKRWAERLHDGIVATLKEAAKQDFVASLYNGVFGSREDGAYPGRYGKGTVEEL